MPQCVGEDRQVGHQRAVVVEIKPVVVDPYRVLDEGHARDPLAVAGQPVQTGADVAPDARDVDAAGGVRSGAASKSVTAPTCIGGCGPSKTRNARSRAERRSYQDCIMRLPRPNVSQQTFVCVS